MNRAIKKKLERVLAVVLAVMLAYVMIPANSLQLAAQQTVSGSNVSDGNVSGGDVPGPSVSGGDVSGGDVVYVYRIEITPEPANVNGYYHSDVKVDIAVSGDNPTGIQTVEYWIENGSDNVTQKETLFQQTASNAEPINNVTRTITVDALENNSDNVIVGVSVKDGSGNETTKTTALKINTIPPQVSVSSEDVVHTEAEAGYYNISREMVVTVEDRADTFDESAVAGGIQIQLDGRLTSLSGCNAEIGAWEHEGDRHWTTVTFAGEGAYDWALNYTNKAGLSDDQIEITGNDVEQFVIDKTAPQGTITLGGRTWNKLLEKLTFGIFKNTKLTAEVTEATDAVGMKDGGILYYEYQPETEGSGLQVLDAGTLEDLYTQNMFDIAPVSVEQEELFVIYARLTDKAGNTTYISTGGAVYDRTESLVQIIKPEVNEHGYCKADEDKEIVIPVRVNDAVSGGDVYSGIQSVSYIVTAGGMETQSGKLFKFDTEDPEYGQLVAELSLQDKTETIVVDAGINNSDNVKVIVTAMDNAGNIYSDSVDLKINVDTDKPVARIDFKDTPQTVAEQHGHQHSYYNEPRTAEITITDRATSFNAEKATAGITFAAVDINGQPITLEEGDVEISPWVTEENRHTATVTFRRDGNYTWSFAYTNKADNGLAAVHTEEHDYPFCFTVDSQDPTGTVTIRENIWSKLVEKLTFGLFSQVSLEVKAEGSDLISPVTIAYLTSASDVALSEEQLKEMVFESYTGQFPLDPKNQVTVYVKITDYAGNEEYISSNGWILDNESSEITATLSDTSKCCAFDEHKDKPCGLYNKDSEVFVDIKVEELVSDSQPFYSGIQLIEYVVKNGSEETQSGELYRFDNPAPTKEELKQFYERRIEIDKALNNSCDVTVCVRTVDNAGNENQKIIDLDIDTTSPVVEVSFDNNTDNGGNTYFNQMRTATVRITERPHHFDAAKATESIRIQAVDAKGQTVEDAYTISSWKLLDENAKDGVEAAYEATVTFAKDANYNWSIAYEDAAGNKQGSVDIGESVAAWDFTIDREAPEGTVLVESVDGRKAQWSELRKDDITYGFWSNSKIAVTGKFEDATSAPIALVEYYKVKAATAGQVTRALTESVLDRVTEWTPFDRLEVASDEQFVLYLKITDLAGNYRYISTNGIIVDYTVPVEENVAPVITAQAGGNVYNGDVNVAVAVKDPQVGGTYSGLKRITYQVLNMGVVTQAGTLYEFTNGDPNQEELDQTWTGGITVLSSLNNSNDVKVLIAAEDNALNGSSRGIELRIDTTAPQIAVNYDNNSADSGAYFKSDRTAYITVTERNFDPGNVSVVITNSEGVIPGISGWTQGVGSGNLDNTTWTSTVKYDAEGDYTFAVYCKDTAGNTSSGVLYGENVSPTEFTIDKTKPVVTVSYDNNDALNSHYYSEERVATIVIDEHNLDPHGSDRERIDIRITALDDGKAAAVPAVSEWSTVGDRHTATIRYSGDAQYSFDVTVRDKAGNVSADFEQQSFVVDKTAPSITISGVADQSANKGKVIPVISYWDTNFDPEQAEVTLTGANRGEVLLQGTYEDIHNGKTFTFEDFAREKEMDDIYTLTVSLTDMAGNKTTESIQFSVNRFGSTYLLSDEAKALNGTYVKQPITVVMTEINPDELSNIIVTMFKNGETIELKEDKDYSIDVQGGDGLWYSYTYTILAQNFAEDGVYTLTLESDDAAGNKAKSDQDTKDAAISFGVDATLPIINIENLDSDTTYAVEKITVNMNVRDNLKLAKVIAELDGRELKVWSAEELEEIIKNGGNFSIDIEGNSTDAHRLVVYAVDAAGNGEKTSAEAIPANAEIAEDFYVTTNLWVRYYTNEPLFYGSIAGVIGVIGLAGFLYIYRKKKRRIKNKSM